MRSPDERKADSVARGALAARGTRRQPIHGGSMAASMPPTVPQAARTPRQNVGRSLGKRPIVGKVVEIPSRLSTAS
ncbi:hypothetical protein CDO09_05190 [Xanthomonas perforans]|nr:hypothetical protein CDO09_05190 [Xanthomonas perforans]